MRPSTFWWRIFGFHFIQNGIQKFTPKKCRYSKSDTIFELSVRRDPIVCLFRIKLLLVSPAEASQNNVRMWFLRDLSKNHLFCSLCNRIETALGFLHPLAHRGFETRRIQKWCQKIVSGNSWIPFQYFWIPRNGVFLASRKHTQVAWSFGPAPENVLGSLREPHSSVQFVWRGFNKCGLMDFPDVF